MPYCAWVGGRQDGGQVVLKGRLLAKWGFLMVLHNVLQRTCDVALKCAPFGFSQGDSRGDKPAVIEPIIAPSLLECVERSLIVVMDFHLIVCASLERSNEAVLFVNDDIASSEIDFVCVHGIAFLNEFCGVDSFVVLIVLWC